MCIRDRLELAQEEDDESMLPEIQELAKHFRTELESQKLATLLSGCLLYTSVIRLTDNRFIGFYYLTICRIVRPVAVSYTHLDVYKRQPHAFEPQRQ